MSGNRRCPACRGSGVVMTAAGYRKCGCVAGTRETRELLAKANDTTVGPRLTMRQMLEMGSSRKEGK